MKTCCGHKRMIRMIAYILAICACWSYLANAQESTASESLARTNQAYGSRLTDGSIYDWEGRGQIVLTGYNKSQPLDFILIVKGNDKVKVIISTPDNKQLISAGYNGKESWQSSGPFSGKAGGSMASVIACQTKRSIVSLFDKSNKLNVKADPIINPLKISKPGKILETTNAKGKITRYYLDDQTSLIAGLEYETGRVYRILFDDDIYPVIASNIFSDYRNVDGVMRPFKIEMYQGLTKTEVLTFTSIQHNVGVTDSIFAQ
jgi:hypothetical protein